MKKIFTFVAAAMAALTINAAETVIFEGSEVADWSNRINLDVDWSTVNAGDTLVFEATITDNESYSAFHLISADWNTKVVSDLGFTHEVGTTQYTAHVLTAEQVTSAVAVYGLGVQGTGFTLTHAWLRTPGSEPEPQPEVQDLDSAVLYRGNDTINGWGGKSLVINDENPALVNFTDVYTQAAAANMYIRVEPVAGSDLRISGQWGAWGETAFPCDGYNHYSHMDADNVIKVELTADFINSAFIEAGGISFWGNGGVVIKTIATTKAAALSEESATTVENVKAIENSVRYNLMGQEVSEDYQGIVILNGQKMLQ